MNDIEIFKDKLRFIKTSWDGKEAIMEMKEGKSTQWRQMEWIGFYFEFLSNKLLSDTDLRIPGSKYGNVEFDISGSINWDLKSHAIKSDSHRVILNDKEAIDMSIAQNGSHGFVIAMLDVEYNDDNRSFQKWHDVIKGGQSDYVKENIRRRATSRYRKTSATLMEILILTVDADSKDILDEHKQGRNSDGNPRRPKYMLDLEKASPMEKCKINFGDIYT